MDNCKLAGVSTHCAAGRLMFSQPDSAKERHSPREIHAWLVLRKSVRAHSMLSAADWTLSAAVEPGFVLLGGCNLIALSQKVIRTQRVSNPLIIRSESAKLGTG